MKRLTCPVCDSSSSPDYLFDRSFTDRTINEYMSIVYGGNAKAETYRKYQYKVAHCRCGFIYQEEVLPDNELSELYDEWIEPVSTELHNRNMQYGKSIHLFRQLRFAVKHMSISPSLIKVLDFGSGFGELMFLAKAMGIDAYALDYSNDRVERLKTQGFNAITNNDMENMSFDFIALNQVLEHLADPRDVLSKVHRSLSSSGIIYVGVPDSSQCKSAFKNAQLLDDASAIAKSFRANQISAFQHINYFTNKTLKLLLNNCGFEVLFDPWNEIKTSELHPKSVLRPFYNYVKGTFLYARKCESK